VLTTTVSVPAPAISHGAVPSRLDVHRTRSEAVGSRIVDDVVAIASSQPGATTSQASTDGDDVFVPGATAPSMR
jgi:hypothetical protein